MSLEGTSGGEGGQYVSVQQAYQNRGGDASLARRSTAVQRSMGRELVAGGFAVSVATGCTNPIDVVKARMQMVSIGRSGLFQTAVGLVEREGTRGLCSGLSPALLRAATYGGVRLGFYEPLKPLFGAEGKNAPLLNRIMAGVTAGTMAAGLTNPMDLIKTRSQIHGASEASMSGALRAVVRESGVSGLWRGSVPGMLRAGILTSAQLVTYGECKKHLIEGLSLKDGLQTHFYASMMSGLIATTATNPVDVVKTRVYARPDGNKGFFRHFIALVRLEGLRGCFKGWSASYIRIGPQTMITFLVYEQVRSLVGLKSL